MLTILRCLGILLILLTIAQEASFGEKMPRTTKLADRGFALRATKGPKPSSAKTPGGDFRLKVTPIESLEGGPVILRATLSFQGKKPVEMYFERPETELDDFSTPKGWERIAFGRIYLDNGLGGGYRTVKPGDQFSKTVYVHEQFKRIPNGRASVKLNWGVQLKGELAREITTEVALNVPPATPERLARIRKRMEAVLDRPDLSDDDRRSLYRWIYRTRHAAFVPVALRLIASRHRAFYEQDLIEFAYCVSEKPNEVHAALVALACDPAWDGQLPIFRYWLRTRCVDDPTAPDELLVYIEDMARDPMSAKYVDQFYPYWPKRRPPLPTGEFAKLLDAKNTWTKILTYETFPRRCPREWKRKLLEDCRQLTRSLPQTEFAQLLHTLDDDSFRVREKASLQLQEFGERVESQLQQALRTDLSPEARHRVRFILKRIAAAKKTPVWKPILEHLSSVACDKDAARAVLQALAKGKPDAELTKAAVASLANLTTRK